MEDGDPLGQLPQGDRNRARAAGDRPIPVEVWARGPAVRRARAPRARRRRWHPSVDLGTPMRWPGGPVTSVVSGTAAGRSAPDRTKVRKSTPSTSSMVKNQLDPSAVSSWSVTRLGWDTSARARNSCLKRRMAAESARLHGLEGHRHAALLVERPVDDPHAAAAQDAQDLVAGDLGMCRVPVGPVGFASHGQGRRGRGPVGGGLAIGGHRAVQLDLELQLAGILGEPAHEFLEQRPLAPLLAEQELGEDQVDDGRSMFFDGWERFEVILGGHPLTQPACSAWSTLKALTICSGSRMPACSRKSVTRGWCPSRQRFHNRRHGSKSSGPSHPRGCGAGVCWCVLSVMAGLARLELPLDKADRTRQLHGAVPEACRPAGWRSPPTRAACSSPARIRRMKPENVVSSFILGPRHTGEVSPRVGRRPQPAEVLTAPRAAQFGSSAINTVLLPAVSLGSRLYQAVATLRNRIKKSRSRKRIHALSPARRGWKL